MLFEKRFWAGIADGSITITFRRWKKPHASAGRPNRTPAGIVNVISVDSVEPASISDADARAAGYPDAATLVADLRGDPGDHVYRIEFRRSEVPDARDELAAVDAVGEQDLEALQQRLDRLDRAGASGPWTLAVLELIEANPARRSGDLAPQLGREILEFKTDVRKLKNLGLTISLGTGYRISPRGAAYIAWLRKRTPPA
jgi:hypothetical protein